MLPFVLCYVSSMPIDNLLDYFLGGADHGGILPPTPEGEPLSHESAAIVSSSVPLHHAHTCNTRTFGGGVGGSENGNDNRNPMIIAQPLHHQYQQQQQQQVSNHPPNQKLMSSQQEQKNHIRFSIDNGHNMNNGAVNFSSGYNTSSTNKNAHEFQPPPTPAVQHFYARSSSNTSTAQAPVSLQQHQLGTNGARNEMHQFHQPPVVQPTVQIHPNKTTNVFNKHSQHISMLYNASQQAKSNHDHSNMIFPTPSNGTSMLQMHNPFQTTQQSNNTQPHHTTNVSSSVPTTSTYNNRSPISPAAICTSEVMIFPPPPRPSSSYASTSTVQHNNQNAMNTQSRQWQQIQPSPSPTLESANDESQISHTSWLQHVNNIAMNANNTTNGTVPISTQQQQQQQPVYTPIISHPQHHVIARQHHTTDILPIPTTSAAAAAAALHHYNSIANNIGIKTVESKEKREKRLARNRESARQSRRRKKELLYNLEVQVNKLNTEIETERRRQLINMEKEMVVAKNYLMTELMRKYKEGLSHDGTIRNEQDIDQLLDLIVRDAGPNIATRRAAASFQCNALRQLLLPGYQQFFLAMSLREESFFTNAKEMKSKVSL